MAINVFIIIRVFIGGVFLVSGFEKLITHYQNFLYVIQSYEFLPTALEGIAARTVPWAELFLGLFLVAGLWFRRVLPLVMTLIAMFLLIVGQALVRGLPVDECGCFGGLVSLPLAGVFAFDSMMMVLCVLIWKKQDKANLLSVDHGFSANN